MVINTLFNSYMSVCILILKQREDDQSPAKPFKVPPPPGFKGKRAEVREPPPGYKGKKQDSEETPAKIQKTGKETYFFSV